MEIILFGIARDIVGKSSLDLSSYNEKPHSVGELIHLLNDAYPDFNKLSSLAVAVNGEYASLEAQIGQKDEIAIIPPVSGG
ncbi:MoaD/ThiS family protein [Maribacter polysiphoniae]|uniref:Molybdopterin synthase sulfur carrier subunit n=1 Tax=Maribacter polysiphoniae TaxID=429344 RepID=A0A316DVA4_9FLAO|nr:MoaD/ThiS family protein [Maribacter polysiphoniae]MBD1263036.1 MoaD/ThiS family protein [Maribacter polysiphoniae]PWK22031.1 molybdopterin synthase sulfur carrier subunit [Maribacter polysiphoniae]